MDESPVVKDQLEALVRSVTRIASKLEPGFSRGIRSFAGTYDADGRTGHVHPVLAYGTAAAALTAIATAESSEARTAGALLFVARLGLSAGKRGGARALGPDFVWGAAAIAAPFVFGYAKKDPLPTLTHIASGATVLVGSLFRRPRRDSRFESDVHPSEDGVERAPVTVD